MRTIDAEKQADYIEVILGVDTHLDFHVAVAVDITWADVWASPAYQRPRRVTRGSSAGRRASVSSGTPG